MPTKSYVISVYMGISKEWEQSLFSNMQQYMLYPPSAKYTLHACMCVCVCACMFVVLSRMRGNLPKARQSKRVFMCVEFTATFRCVGQKDSPRHITGA